MKPNHHPVHQVWWQYTSFPSAARDGLLRFPPPPGTVCSASLRTPARVPGVGHLGWRTDDGHNRGVPNSSGFAPNGRTVFGQPSRLHG